MSMLFFKHNLILVTGLIPRPDLFLILFLHFCSQTLDLVHCSIVYHCLDVLPLETADKNKTHTHKLVCVGF